MSGSAASSSASRPRPRKRRRRRRAAAAEPPPPSPPPPPPPPAGPDYLSNLPDDLLLLILRRIPTRTAAAASALSRRFRHLPPLLPRLDSLAPTDPTLALPADSHLLLRRLELSCTDPDSDRIQPYHLHGMLSTAASHGVSELHIRLAHRSRIPRIALAVQSLQVLHLENCMVPHDGVVVLCPLLRTLKLERVCTRRALLAAVLAATPALETLHLISCSVIDAGCVHVEAPGVRRFVFCPPLEQDGAVVAVPGVTDVTLRTSVRMRRFQLGPAPEVRNAYLNLARPRERPQYRLRPFLEAGTGLVSLKLRGATTKLLSSEYREIPKLEVSFQDLRILAVTVDFSSESEVVFLLKLLESCPSIQKLNLSASDAREEHQSPTFSEAEHKERMGNVACLVQHLKEFELVGFKKEPYPFEEDLVRLLLTRAKKLKQLIVEFPMTQRVAMKEILSVRKAPIERTCRKRNNYRIQLEFS